MEQEFIILTADATGKIDGAAFFRAPAEDGFKAARSRAVLSGSEKFWVFRVIKDEGRGAGKSQDASLSFEPVEKQPDKKMK